MDDELKELDEVELEDEAGVELPAREVMSLVDVGDSLGAPPMDDTPLAEAKEPLRGPQPV